jgi:prepilin-type N-terminal cleavage/methylation domain-containing protein
MRSITKHQHDEGGFTLIELLIVVVILGILAAVVVFAVANSTSNTSKQACKTEAKQFVNAYTAYQANHRGAFVTGGTTAAMATNLAADSVLTSATLRYLSPAQGGTVASASSPRWTFNVSNAIVDTSAC